ncbi:MAG TPA: hypothetical protein VJB58_01475 [Candidatus Paceibacterota bacterium]
MATKIQKYKKLFASLIVVTVFTTSFSPIFARRAEAFVFTDWVNFAVNAVTSITSNALWVKEYALDAVAYKMLDLIIQRMTASTVNWINSGFNGSPAYVADPTAYFQSVGDRVAGSFIADNPNLNFLCGPISAQIKIALAQSYSGYNESWQCTLSDAYGNMEDFINDFERGGWDKFFRLTQEPQNNPIGAYLQAEGSLARVVAQELGEKEKELDWGRGFMSFQTCEKYPLALPGETEPSCIPGTESTQTPGSVIEGQLGEVLSIGGKKLAVADEINEIISALLNQLVSRVIGGIGGGLRGLSGSDPANNNQSFTAQLNTSANNAAIDTYFNLSNQSIQNTLNTPTPNPYACRENPNLPECLPPPGDPNNTDGQGVITPPISVTPTPTCDPALNNCETAGQPPTSQF